MAVAAVIGLLVVGAASFSDRAPGLIADIEDRLNLPQIGEPTLHLLGWMAVTVLVTLAIRRFAFQVLAAGGVLLLSLVIEVLQPSLSSSRSFEAGDAVANLMGVVIGLIVGNRLARTAGRSDSSESPGELDAIAAFVFGNFIPLLVAGAGFGFAVGSSFLVGLNPVIGAVLYVLIVLVAIGAYRLLQGGPIAWDGRLQRGRLFGSALIAVVVVGLAIQAIPYGRDHTNPPITGEPAWDSPETRALTVRACFDCHSNEVEYPWYSNIAPISWAVQSHVDAGRAKVNYSEWDQPQDKADESAETVRDGEMPPPSYTRFAHADAMLSDAELRRLIAGLVATFGDDD
jgi:hypothetical protein